MPNPSILIWRCTAIALLALLAMQSVSASTPTPRVVRLDVERLTAPGISASSLALQMDASSLHLRSDRIEAAAIGFDGPLDWQCQLALSQDGARECVGPLAGNFSKDIQLAVRLDGKAAVFTLERGEASLRFSLPLVAAEPITVDVSAAELSDFAVPLRRYLPQMRLRSGLMDARVSAMSTGAIAIQFQGRDVVADLADGVGLLGVDIAGNATLDSAATSMPIQLDATLAKGAIETGLTRIELSAQPTKLQLDALALDNGRWNIRQLTWDDPGSLTLTASGEINPATNQPLTQLLLTIADADLPSLRQRYLQRLSTQYGLDAVDLRGRFNGDVVIEDGKPIRVDISSKGLSLSDPSRAFSVDGLAGRYVWSPVGKGPETGLRWTAANYAGQRIGPLAVRLRSDDGAVELAQPLQFGLAGGSVQLRSLRLDPLAATDTAQLQADFSLRNLGYDSADGAIAAVGLSADSQISVADLFGLPRVSAVTQWRGGELLYGAHYVKLPSTPIDMALQAQMVAPQQWDLARLDWSDPGVVDFHLEAKLQLDQPNWLPAMRLDLHQIALAPAVNRYARAWLMSNGYADLKFGGTLAGEIDFDDDGLQRFAFYASAISVDDGAGRYGIQGLSGGVDWAFGQHRPATTLAWNAMKFYSVPFGPAVAPLASRDGAIELTEAMVTEVLGGKLKLEKLSLQPRSPRGQRYRAAMSVAAIEMSQLSSALGWPSFPGNLSGGIPDITLSGDRIVLGGGLDLYVFDGKVIISGVSLSQPFSANPVLGAGIYLRGLDLAQVTSAFEVAGVSGRLDGDIKQFRMENWSPVAFDAWLRTKGGGRMSYKVVQDVTSIGGGLGSITTALQNLAMRVVDTFGYSQLGIRCVLADKVCSMGGIDPAATADSYTIVAGAGVPRIDIVGHRRRVDWPTFIDRVIEAISGKGPIVE